MANVVYDSDEAAKCKYMHYACLIGAFVVAAAAAAAVA